MTYQYLFGLILSFIIATVCGIFVIPVLKRLKFGQEIREEGPKWHAGKSGTPTMGGFIFIIAIVLSVVICYGVAIGVGFSMPVGAELTMALVVSLAFGIIGFIDDYIKVILKRNLGLTAKQKFGLQLVVAIGFVCWAVYGNHISTIVNIPFFNTAVDFRWFYIPFTVVVILGTVNSVNLTDGLDGLATCITIVVATFFILFSQLAKEINPAITLFASVLTGSLLGFLIYNKFPAKVFMGDTGSLFLGGAVCSMAILLEQPIALLIVGFVYVAEALSVILQVASFKITGKRIFKMSPIHHHFEMCGWSEKKVVTVFSLVTAVLCVLMYFFG